jgi:hypothetical protein
LIFATDPVEDTASNTTRITRWPALSGMATLEIVCQFCHPPVLGTVMAPVRSWPSTLTWKRPPAPLLATRASIR